ncbi:MAG: selenium metabolism-associated LysR family transcriptional regulator [Chloroflexota bacterium]
MINKTLIWDTRVSVTLVQLQTFARLAELGNFTRVAEVLHLTQPAVTQQVRSLERHFGVRLVDIVGRRPVLTDAGRFLAGRARELLIATSLLEKEMSEFAAARGGEFRIGATLTIGTYALPAILAHFGAEHPGISIQVEVANTQEMVRRVTSGALGLALIEGPLEHDGLTVIPFKQDRLVLITSPHHPFAARRHIRLSDLDGQPFVWRERGSGTRLLVERALNHAGVHVHTALELPGGEGVSRAVEEGIGITIVSALVVERALAGGQLMAVEIEDLDLHRTFRLIHVHGRSLSPAARVFIQVLTSSST